MRFSFWELGSFLNLAPNLYTINTSLIIRSRPEAPTESYMKQAVWAIRSGSTTRTLNRQLSTEARLSRAVGSSWSFQSTYVDAGQSSSPSQEATHKGNSTGLFLDRLHGLGRRGARSSCRRGDARSPGPSSLTFKPVACLALKPGPADG